MLHHARAAALLLAVSACTGNIADPAQSAFRPPVEAHRYSASASTAPTDSLHVSIGGRISVSTPSTQRYSASISNGSATRYYYQWFTLDCLSYCSTSPLTPFAEGEGLSSVYIDFASTNDQKDISVHISEIDGNGRAGSMRIETEGPNMVSSGGGLVYAPCSYYDDIFYPLHGPYTDPFTGQTRDRPFRRNNCNNSIDWDPSH